MIPQSHIPVTSAAIMANTGKTGATGMQKGAIWICDVRCMRVVTIQIFDRFSFDGVRQFSHRCSIDSRRMLASIDFVGGLEGNWRTIGGGL